MRYPENLKENGTIGFLAPSFGCATEPYKSAFDHSLKVWEEKGYKLILGPNCYASEGIGISNTPEKCGKEVMDMFANEEADILISCGGGELMCTILDYVDFEKLSNMEPKWFMGYSDNTNLTFLLPTLSDMVAIYGPCAQTFGMEPWHESLNDCMNILTGKSDTVTGYELWEKESLKDEEHPLVPYNVTEKRILVLEHPENKTKFEMSGRLLGGCLDCLQTLIGTKYDKVDQFNEKYKEDGILWFIEACDLNVLSIQRALWQAYHAGWFDNAKGFLIGRPRNGEAIMGLDQYKAVMNVLKACNVPVVMDVDLGHVAPMMPFISGAYADVKIDGNDISVEMKRI